MDRAFYFYKYIEEKNMGSTFQVSLYAQKTWAVNRKGALKHA